MALIAQNAPITSSAFDLLQFVADEIYQYSALLQEDQESFEKKTQTKGYLKKIGTKWSIKNPINPNDNYTENWTKKDARYFFNWIRAVKTDFIDNVNDS